MIRALYSVVLLSIVLTAGVPAQTPEQKFQEANGLYQRGKIAEARDLYQAVVQEGFISGPLYYNLGNAYYRTGDIGRAILNYERALRLMPTDEDVQHNLAMANLRITDRIEPVPRLVLWEYWDGVKNWFSLLGATWAGYAIYCLLLASIAAVFLARSYRLRKTGFVASFVSGLLLVFFVVLFLAKVADTGRTDEAIVVAPITTVKNSPDTRSSDAFVLHAGVKVWILDGVNEWLKVRLADGKVGWMEKSAADII
jgi:tetratricopeptide (TPR) repeat protein